MTDNNSTNGETLASQAKDVLEDGLEAATGFVKRQWRENPVAVVAAAAGVGLIVGLLLGRRR